MELDTKQADNAAAEAQDAPEAAEQQEQPKEHKEPAKGKKKKQEQAEHDADEDKDGSSPKKQPLLHVTVVEGKRERKKVGVGLRCVAAACCSCVASHQPTNALKCIALLLLHPPCKNG